MAWCSISAVPYLLRSLLIKSRNRNIFNWYPYIVLFITFVSYTNYHLTRKCLSVVKSELDPNSLKNKTNCSGWAPFDGPHGSSYLGALDTAFLISYAVAMFFSGQIAERSNLRYFLSLGMFGTSIITILFGFGKYFNVHHISFFLIIQTLSGLLQSTGWPAVVTIVSNWFGEGRRGLIMGAWNSHTSLGNILGSLVASYFVNTDWALAFIVPGIIMALSVSLVWFFLIPSSQDLENFFHHIENHPNNSLQSNSVNEDNNNNNEDSAALLGDDLRESWNDDLPEPEAISFKGALLIPGVLEFSLCLFFSKMVSYTFLFWLPFYISTSTNYGPSTSAELSTLFDIGGLLGGIVAGIFSDLFKSNALSCAVMFFLAAPVMYCYYLFAKISLGANILLLLATGFLVNGPYALITTAVSANLGQHPSLEGRCKALSTVICIIDGTGSFGAVLGPLLTSLISPYGWIRVFQMLIVSDLLALLVSVYIHYRLVNRTNTGGLMRLKFSFLRIDLKFFLATLIVLCFFITFYLATI